MQLRYAIELCDGFAVKCDQEKIDDVVKMARKLMKW